MKATISALAAFALSLFPLASQPQPDKLSHSTHRPYLARRHDAGIERRQPVGLARPDRSGDIEKLSLDKMSH